MTKSDKAKATGIKERIQTEEEYAIGTLMTLFSFQTDDEQAVGVTHHKNGMGFNGQDAPFLTSLAETYSLRKKLSPRQVEYVKKRCQKYWKQLEGVEVPLLKNLYEVHVHKREEKKRKAVLWNNAITISFPYDPNLVHQVKRLEGRRYIADTKEWTAPLSVSNVEMLKEMKLDRIDPAIEKWYSSLMEDTELVEVEVKDFKKVLRSFQKKAVGFLDKRNGRGLLGDEMGLGKTIESLAWLQKHKAKRPALVVCPASVKLNWAQEVKDCMGVKATVLYGKTPSVPHRADVLIINYDILQAWEKTLMSLHLKVIILDECHMIKNRNAKRTEVVKRMAKKIPHVIAMSGTPVINRPVEMFNAINLIEPGLFPSFFKYAQKYCGAKHNGFGWDFTGASRTEELHNILTKTIMLRRLKKDVLKELPEKIRTVIPLEIINRKEYKKLDEDFEDTVQKSLDKVEGTNSAGAEALVKIEMLKQCCLRGKINSCVQWIEDFIDGGEKLVVFCWHKAAVQQLAEKFKDICVVLDGSTKQLDRQIVVDQFQNDDKIRLFIGNIKAAGIGITLTAASSTCFIELGWTVSEHRQAEDRVHRIGQEADSVNAYYLVAQDTIEEEIADMLDKKKCVVDNILDGKVEDEESMLGALLRKRKEKK